MWSRPVAKLNMEDSERMSNVGFSSSEQMSSSDDESIYERQITKKSTSNESGSTSGGQQSTSRQSRKYESSERRPKATKRKSVLQVYSDFNNRDSSVKLPKFKQEDEEEFQPSRYKSTGTRQKCHSHNAIMARQNRLKKKQHLEKLENNISKLSGENKKLKCVVNSQKETVTSLQDRVRYLESVLANSREIGMLLKSVKNATGLPVINSLQQMPGNSSHSLGCPPPQLDHIYSKMPEDVSNGYISSGEDILANSFQTDDYLNPLPMLSADIPFSLIPTDDLPPYSPNPDLDSAFNFESLDADELFSNVGICLHIAKKRVSLEFCSNCNSNAVNAWDHQQACVN